MSEPTMPDGASPTQHFAVEAREHLAAMTAALMALEHPDGEPVARLEELFRASHSLKGGAGFSGHGTIERLAHAFESAVERLRDSRAAPTPEFVDTLLFAIDRIGALVDDAEHSHDADITQPLARLQSVGGPADGATSPTVAPPPTALARPATSGSHSTAAPGEFPISERVREAWSHETGFLYGVKLDWFQCERAFELPPLEIARRLAAAGAVIESRTALTGPPLTEGLPAPPFWYWAIVSSRHGPDDFARTLNIPCAAIVRLERVGNGPRPEPAPPPAAPRAPASANSLRIPVALIDRMLGLAGELVLIRNQAAHATDASSAPARHLMRRLSAITNELQDAALRMRTQPVGTLFDRFPRLVRDLARQLGKQIDLVITGREVELDKTMLDLLSDPLTHLVRNCCDHGIESPAERIRAGKPATGVIRLSASQEHGQILIAIRDDGRGLDREAIRRKALQQGVKRSDELDRLSDRQLYDLILLSGFSTASKVTDLSGRGVGMDVVRTNLEQVGGVVEIDSVTGQGATFALRLPLTLAIMPCLMLQSGAERFVLPQRDVEEVVLIDPRDGRLRIEYGDNEEILRLRGRLLPLARLTEVLARREPFDAAVLASIVARHHGSTLAGVTRFVVVVKVGSQRFGLVVDAVLGGADIVVKPLHPLLRSLGIYTGTTILGDGSVALILSGDGLARHSGIAYRPREELAAPPSTASTGGAATALLQFRCGPDELLAVPLETVSRVVTIAAERITRIGERELVDIDGRAVNVLRLDQFLHVSRCPDTDRLFLIMPRRAETAVGLLASEIIDTPTQVVTKDERAYRADGVLGTLMMRGQIALLLDLDRLVTIWGFGHASRATTLPGPEATRILVVEDTKFFQQLVARALESAGYAVTVADDAEAGLAQLENGAFNLVVSDIEMPVLDGLELARRIRADRRFARLPLVALTSLASEEHRARSIAAGFDAHEVKFDRERFLRVVDGLLATGRAIVTRPGGSIHD